MTDKKKRKKIILIIVLVFSALVAIWFLFLRGFLIDRLNISPDNLFPFGDPTPRNQESGQVTPEEGPSGGGIRPDEFEPISRDRLRLIFDEPVAGFVPVETNRYYPSQSSISEYNAARGSIALDSLPVIRSPRLHVSRSIDADVFEVYAGNVITDSHLIDTFIPNIASAILTDDGFRVATQHFNRDTNIIETFVGSISDNYSTLRCEIPNRVFTVGETHPSVRSLKAAAAIAYELDSDISDTLSAEFVESLFSLPTLDIQQEVTTTTQLSGDLLGTIQTNCEVAYLQLFNYSLPMRLTGDFLTHNIAFIDKAPHSQEFYGIEPEQGFTGRTLGFVRQLDTDAQRLVFSSNFSEWLIDWVNPSTIIMQTKPSFDVEGYAYILNPVSQRFDKIEGPELGLVTLMSPNGLYLLYSYTANGSTRTAVRNTQTGEVVNLPLTTFPDKCTWTSTSDRLFCGIPTERLRTGEPDLWFQGISSYSDTVWMILPDGSEIKQVYSPISQDGKRIDIHQPQLDPFEANYLYFLDKKTNHLWSLEIDGLDEFEE